MTRKEAIAIFKGFKFLPREMQAVDMAIRALEKEPCEDAISRQAVIEKLRTCYDTETKEYSDGRKTGHWISHKEHCEMNNLRPSGLGSYFWCSECDCGIDSNNFSRVNYNYCPNCGAEMVEPKTGRWIDDKCSVCGRGIEDLIDSHEWYKNEEPNFCPFCGLKLVDSQESEEEE